MVSESFAVIVAGGRQCRVAPGELVQVDRLNVEADAEVTFDQVLLVSANGEIKVGNPTLPGAAVKGKVVREFRDRKVIVFHRKRRKGFRKTRGHREYYTLVRIEAIEAGH